MADEEPQEERLEDLRLPPGTPVILPGAQPARAVPATPQAASMQEVEDSITAAYFEHHVARTGSMEERELEDFFGPRDKAPPPDPEPDLSSPEATVRTAKMLVGGGGRKAYDLGARGTDYMLRNVSQIPRGMVRGARDAVQNALELGNRAGDEVVKLITGGVIPQPMATPQLPEIVTTPDLPAGQLAKGVTQFLLGFALTKKLPGMEKLGEAAKTSWAAYLAEGAARGAVADFTVMDWQGDNLRKLIDTYPALKNPVSEYLAGDPDDSQLESRFKNALLGIIPGTMVDAFVLGVKGVRARIIENARATEGPRGAAVAAEAAEAARADQAVTDRLKIIGDPENPDLLMYDRAIGPTQATPTENLNLAIRDAEGAAGKIEPGDIEARGVIPERKVEINFARVDTDADIMELWQRAANGDLAGIQAKRGGAKPESLEQVAKDAEAIDPVEALFGRRPKEVPVLNAREATAARQLWTASAEALAKAAKAAKDAPGDAAALVAFRKMVAVHYAIQRQIMAARTEVARALNAWKIPAAGKNRAQALNQILDQYGGPGLAQEMAAKIAQASDAGMTELVEAVVEKGVFAKTWDAFLQVWINGLLSAPATHVVNQMSNTAVLFHQVAERAVASQISRLAGTADGVELEETVGQLFGIIEGVKDAYRALHKSGKMALEAAPKAPGPVSKFRTVYDGVSALSDSMKEAGGALEQHGGALSAEAAGVILDTPLGQGLELLDVATSVPSRLLKAGDEVFKSIGYRMELHAQAHRKAIQMSRAGEIKPGEVKAKIAEIIADPAKHPEIQARAIDQAIFQTFAQAPEKVLDDLGRAWRRLPLVGMLTMPFKNVPINAAMYVLNRTPLAPLLPAWQKAMKAGGAEADLALARYALGSLTMMAVMDAAYSGHITGGGPTRPQEKQWLRRQGRPPYSVKIGNKWVSYNRLEPIGSLLGIAADLVDVMKQASDAQKDSIDALKVGLPLAMMKNFTSKTFLKGMSDFFQALADPAGKGIQWTESLAGTLVPAGVAAVTRYKEPEIKMTEDYLDEIKSRTWWWNDELAPDRELWGDIRTSETVMGPTWDLISPVKVYEERVDPIERELGELKFYPAMPPKNVTLKKLGYREGVEVDLSKYPHAYSRYVELAGNALKLPKYGNQGAKDALNAIVQGKHPRAAIYNQRKRVSNEAAANWIRGVLQDYRDAALQKLIKEFPDLDTHYTEGRARLRGR